MAQPHKGPRKLLATTRVHESVYDRIAAEAQRLGVPKGDLVAHALCVVYDAPEHDPLRKVLEQQGEEQMQMTA